MHVRDTIEIERGGRKAATVKKALISPLRPYSSMSRTAMTWRRRATSSSEYKIERDGDKVAEVSKRWFRVMDIYGIAGRTGAG